MNKLILCLLALCTFPFFSATKISSSQSEADEKAFKKLRTDLNLAFINGDIQTVAAYHHPDVVKALGFNNFLVGRDANMESVKGTFQAYSLKFVEHKIETFEIHGNTATEISTFTIEGTPRSTSQPFTFKGRSMVVYIRYSESPAGWALLREMVQTP